MAELDMENRDPNGMNKFIQVEFDDVLAEPEGAHSMDCVWKNSACCFKNARNIVYKLFTLFCGCFIACGWGCTFGCLTIEMVWCYVPMLRYLHILTRPIRKIISIMLSTYVAPMFEAMGMGLSRIHITKSDGPAPAPFGQMDGDENQK